MNQIINKNQLTFLKKVFTSRRFAQSWIFHGPSGTGKFEMALRVAKMLKGKNKQISSATNDCELLVVEPEIDEETGKEKEISIDKIKEVIRKLGFLNKEQKTKLLIVNKAEKLNQYSANALLKIIEEPFEDSIIILITDNLERILPTIASRTIKLFFPLSTQTEIVSALKEIFSSVDNATILKVSELSHGRIETAKKMISDPTELARIEKLIANFRMALKGDLTLGFELADNWSVEKAELERDIDQLVFYLRNVIIKSAKISFQTANRVRFIIQKLLEVKSKISSSNVSVKLILENFFTQVSS